jgi:hypothetical protein
MTSLRALRNHLIRLLGWEEAHASFDTAVKGVPVAQRGVTPRGFEHSLWQLVEHLRLAQKDLLDFAVNPAYEHTLAWPDDYWPADPRPPSARAWNQSLASFRADRSRLQALIGKTRVDLFALVPTGKDRQTLLRAILLVADHNAYHVGQIIAVRRALGIWR